MKALKIVSWNIEHFDGKGGKDKNNRTKRLNRVERVTEYLKDAKPHIFGLSEVEGAIVYDKMTDMLPGYTFNITEGRNSQQILIGVKNGITAFFTQRNEFKRSNPYLRPGALLTVRDGDTHIPILFTHLKSMPSPEGFGLRDAMFDKIFNLKKQLDKASRRLSGNDDAMSNFIVLGDMNTMGMDYEGKQHDIPLDEEVRIVKTRFRRRKMEALSKSHQHTFFNGSDSRYPPSELDHVFAARHLTFKENTDGSIVDVGGWAKKTTDAQKDKWIDQFSDHAPLTITLKDV
jgi:endonuclease/exonuclease/phosphatase family metal-dependent hydrolase